MTDEAEVVKSSGSWAKGIVMFLVALAIGAGATYYIAKSYPQYLGLSKGQVQVQAEVDALIVEVGKLLALPEDEKPTVATITDVSKISEQAFFKNAVNGDKVLIYTNARRAILYRPTEKRIIEVGAVNINQASPAPTVQAPVLPLPSSSASPEVTQ